MQSSGEFAAVNHVLEAQIAAGESCSYAYQCCRVISCLQPDMVERNICPVDLRLHSGKAGKIDQHTSSGAIIDSGNMLRLANSNIVQAVTGSAAVDNRKSCSNVQAQPVPGIGIDDGRDRQCP